MSYQTQVEHMLFLDELFGLFVGCKLRCERQTATQLQMNANKIYFGLFDVWKIILKETILENLNFYLMAFLTYCIGVNS